MYIFEVIMKCIYCGNLESKVLDSRTSDDDVANALPHMKI